MLSATVRSGISDSSWKMQTMPAWLAAAGSAKANLAAVQRHASLVGRDDAGHDLDERRFAGAVLAEDGVDAAGGDGQFGMVERQDAAIALGDPFHPKERRSALHRLLPRYRGLSLLRKAPRGMPAAPGTF